MRGRSLGFYTAAMTGMVSSYTAISSARPAFDGGNVPTTGAFRASIAARKRTILRMARCRLDIAANGQVTVCVAALGGRNGELREHMQA